MANPEHIDQLRHRLRALGYLAAPVDRYVLGAVASSSGASLFALGAGLRVGIVAGLLLGVSAAVALAAAAPGFIASRRDAIVLALMLTALFAIVTAAAVTATVLAASWYARRSPSLTTERARVVAGAAGILVALGCAAYLTLWWSAARDLFTGLTFGWNAAALAIAAAVALLLAHAVSVVILAALARSRESWDIEAGGLLSSRGFLVVFGVVLFAGSAALLATGAGRTDPRADAAPITVVPSGYALRAVAIDGFDLEVGRRLKHELPALARMLDSAGVPLHPEPGASADPARDWTTIATGQPPAVHGIASLEARRALGMEGRLPAASSGIMRSLQSAADLLRLTTPAIASGAERRVPAFWEVAAAAGLRTSVVNWWATWPAPEGDDIVISDRALLRPAGVEPLRARWPAMREAASGRAEAAFASVADPELRKVLVRSAELDALVAALGNVSPGPALDLLTVYLPGLDIAQHNLLQSPAPASVSAMSERVAAIETYYRFLDALVAELLPPSASHIDALMLWPGRVSGRHGEMLLAGGPVQDRGAMTACANCPKPGAAATLLYLLGLPIADDLPTSPMTGIVPGRFPGAAADQAHPELHRGDRAASRPYRTTARCRSTRAAEESGLYQVGRDFSPGADARSRPRARP